jgi:hypothetical protein
MLQQPAVAAGQKDPDDSLRRSHPTTVLFVTEDPDDSHDCFGRVGVIRRPFSFSFHE